MRALHASFHVRNITSVLVATIPEIILEVDIGRTEYQGVIFHT